MGLTPIVTPAKLAASKTTPAGMWPAGVRHSVIVEQLRRAMATESTVSSRLNKPKKPYPDFPLFAHATGRWAKKIRGKFHYFGKWDDADAALQKYLDQRDELHAGRVPRVPGDGLTLADLCNRFLTSKQHLLDAGEITQRTFADYYAVCDRIIAAFGKMRLVTDLAADDFERLRARLAVTQGPVTLGNEINRIRIVFKYGYDAGLIDKPVRYGPSFKRPSKKVLRIARNANGSRMFEAEEMRSILEAVSQPLQAMVLLGINCGFGQTDVANLPRSSLNLDTGWVDFPRPKTGIERRCPLWAQTVEALREATAHRPTPKDLADSDLVFVTKYGQRWVRNSGGEKQSWVDSVGAQFGKLLQRLGLKRNKLSFYALRHTFETIGGEARDQVAVDHIMGHARNDMASLYRERISDERLRRVTDVIHGWLSSDISDTST